MTKLAMINILNISLIGFGVGIFNYIKIKQEEVYIMKKCWKLILLFAVINGTTFYFIHRSPKADWKAVNKWINGPSLYYRYDNPEFKYMGFGTIIYSRFYWINPETKEYKLLQASPGFTSDQTHIFYDIPNDGTPYMEWKSNNLWSFDINIHFKEKDFK
jgi:hypothetical protein